jgi:hypothetical protein
MFPGPIRPPSHSSSMARTPLQVRHEAALALVARGELDPYEAIALVCWPSEDSRLEDETVPTKRLYYSDDVRAEALAL